jgi:uncharacterized lipoprotein NlpE involved in copper resistance
MINRTLFAVLCLIFFLSGCNNQASSSKAESSPTPTPASTPKAVVATETKSPFSAVTSQLDAGGGLYFYWEVDKILAQLTKGITAARDATVLSGKLTPEQSAKTKQQFDIALHLLTSSGLTGFQAIGASSKQESATSYLTKSVVFAPGPSGFLWSAFWKQPHSIDAIDFIPANAEAFSFFDVDLSALWTDLEKDLSASGIPEAVQFAQDFPKQVAGMTAMELSEILGSLGDQAGFIVTLDPNSRVKIPMSGSEVEMAEPAIAILWKVRNEKVFSMLEALAALSQDVDKVDEPNLRLRIINLTESAPYFRPTIARFDDYMVFASNDKLVRALRSVKDGKAPGLKTRADFAAISKGLPDHGNIVQFVSKQFQSAYCALQEKELASFGATDLSPVAAAGLKSLAMTMQDYESYGVLSRTDTGVVSIVRGNKDLADILGQVLALPIYYAGDSLATSQKEGVVVPGPTVEPSPSAETQRPEPGQDSVPSPSPESN